MERQRLTAVKAGMAEIASGRFVKRGGFESSYIITPLGRKFSRVRALGLVVDKFQSEDGNYATITLDDGTETLRCKVFINVKIFDGVTAGDLVDVTGKVREYNGEVYMVPEIIRKVPANWETLRGLELKHAWKQQRLLVQKVRGLHTQAGDLGELKVLATKMGMDPDSIQGILEAQELKIIEAEKKVEATVENRDKILKLIESMDAGQGADYAQVAKQAGLPEAEVDAAITELLESGVCFEPKAGMIKKL